jgi:hypothetical protein
VLETLSTSPRVFALHGFLSESEADAIVTDALAQVDDVFEIDRSTVARHIA